ncbi:MAG: preprotein translocase subunit YajC [Candidatus Sabulitectum sp.]|nr:preprotein translocase subunit YajC [Candidatus Sabulitectum sp.]
MAQETGGGAEEAASAASCLGGGGIMGLLPIVAMVGIFYFLIIRPQQKQSKRMKEMRDSMQKGNNVVTSGGIHGVITNIKGDIVTVRIADSVKIDVDRTALTILGEEVSSTCKTC